MSTPPQKSFFNKTNTTLPNSDKNTSKSKSLQLNFTWTTWEKRLTSHDQVFIPQKRVRRAPFQPLLGARCTYRLSASSMGLSYYIIQCLKTAPLPTKHQGIWDTAPRYPFLPLTHSPWMLLMWGLALPVSSQRHLPCTCCNPIPSHSWCTLHDPVCLLVYSSWLYLPPHQANVLGYPTTHLQT